MKQLQKQVPPSAQEQLQKTEQEIEWIKKELFKPDSVLHNIYASDAPKKDLILHWAYKLEKLHELGGYAHSITHISKTIKDEMEDMGLGMNVHYVHETLPYKYKNPAFMRGDKAKLLKIGVAQQPKISSKPKEANAELLDMVKDTILIFKQAKKALEKKEIIQPHIPELEFLEFQVRWKYAMDRLQDILDGREKVPPTTMHLMMFCIAHYTSSNIYSNYVRFRKEEAELTPKQTGKIIKGHVSKMPWLFEPKNRQEAMSNGFYGQQCSECGTWRTDRVYNANRDKFLLLCFRKGHWTRLKTEKIKVKAK
jgi:hypothetical protein